MAIAVEVDSNVVLHPLACLIQTIVQSTRHTLLSSNVLMISLFLVHQTSLAVKVPRNAALTSIAVWMIPQSFVEMMVVTFVSPFPQFPRPERQFAQPTRSIYLVELGVVTRVSLVAT